MSEEYSLKIIKCNNGFIVEYPDRSRLVYEESADSELAHVQSTLYEIIEFFGYIGSKHDKERLRVNIEPGEDYSETIC